MLIALNKPYAVLCQFSAPAGAAARMTLADFVRTPGVYPAGRLDFDSEGLVLLTDDGALQNFIASPARKLSKTYWVQVERVPGAQALERMREGVVLRDGASKVDRVAVIEEPAILWPRQPAIRSRLHIATAWLELVVSEGRNRQVRRTTAAIGHPTLRLIRAGIGPLHLAGLRLAPGESVRIDPRRLGFVVPEARAQLAPRDLRFRRQPSRGPRR